MKIRSFALALTLAAAPLPLLAQTTTPAAPAQRGEARAARALQRSPVARLIEQRQRLGLSDEQVARLRTVEQQLQARNAPLVERMRTTLQGAAPQGRTRGTPLTEEQRQELRRTRESLRPVREQMRENGRAAREEIRAILTEEQRGRLQEMRREMRREGRAGREGRQGRRARGGHRGGGMHRGS